MNRRRSPAAVPSAGISAPRTRSAQSCPAFLRTGRPLQAPQQAGNERATGPVRPAGPGGSPGHHSRLGQLELRDPHPCSGGHGLLAQPAARLRRPLRRQGAVLRGACPGAVSRPIARGWRHRQGLGLPPGCPPPPTAAAAHRPPTARSLPAPSLSLAACRAPSCTRAASPRSTSSREGGRRRWACCRRGQAGLPVDVASPACRKARRRPPFSWPAPRGILPQTCLLPPPRTRSYQVRMAVVDLDSPPSWWARSKTDNLSAAEARRLAGTTGAHAGGWRGQGQASRSSARACEEQCMGRQVTRQGMSSLPSPAADAAALLASHSPARPQARCGC